MLLIIIQGIEITQKNENFITIHRDCIFQRREFKFVSISDTDTDTDTDSDNGEQVHHRSVGSYLAPPTPSEAGAGGQISYSE